LPGNAISTGWHCQQIFRALGDHAMNENTIAEFVKAFFYELEDPQVTDDLEVALTILKEGRGKIVADEGNFSMTRRGNINRDVSKLSEVEKFKIQFLMMVSVTMSSGIFCFDEHRIESSFEQET